MQCRNHPNVPAVGRCVACAEPFCENCLVEIQGQDYCGSCKIVTLKGHPMLDAATIPCAEAKNALILSIVGLFCVGIILEPLAIIQAVKAKNMMAQNPRMTGSGMANAAIVTAIVGFIVGILNFIAYVSARG